MHLNYYQNQAQKTAVYPNQSTFRGFLYAVIGLSGEAGELSNKVKKVMRDSDGFIGPKAKEEMAAELGDVLWYLSAVATELGLELGDIAEKNLEKLQKRAQKGTLSGSGDNR